MGKTGPGGEWCEFAFEDREGKQTERGLKGVGAATDGDSLFVRLTYCITCAYLCVFFFLLSFSSSSLYLRAFSLTIPPTEGGLVPIILRRPRAPIVAANEGEDGGVAVALHVCVCV